MNDVRHILICSPDLDSVEKVSSAIHKVVDSIYQQKLTYAQEVVEENPKILAYAQQDLGLIKKSDNLSLIASHCRAMSLPVNAFDFDYQVAVVKGKSDQPMMLLVSSLMQRYHSALAASGLFFKPDAHQYVVDSFHTSTLLEVVSPDYGIESMDKSDLDKITLHERDIFMIAS